MEQSFCTVDNTFAQKGLGGREASFPSTLTTEETDSAHLGGCDSWPVLKVWELGRCVKRRVGGLWARVAVNSSGHSRLQLCLDADLPRLSEGAISVLPLLIHTPLSWYRHGQAS